MLTPQTTLYLCPLGRLDVGPVASALASELGLVNDLDRANIVVVLAQDPGVVPLSEAVRRLRVALLPGQEIWVVAPLIVAAGDYEELQSAGARCALAPRSSRPADLAARILGEVWRRRAPSEPDLGLLGHSRAIRGVRADIARFAPHLQPVLIQGETGTGKELVAEALHRLSGRRGVLRAENCGSIPANIAESQLFGHVRGAFTGALAEQRGLLLDAGEGTLFLDEFGELPMDQQVKLLRVLETRKVRPVGGHDEREMKARVVLATNRDLRREVQEGRMREDLYFRLATLTITLPPLRERSEDVPLLAEHFLDRHNRDRRRRTRLPLGGICALMCRRWPGNVRELKGVIERAAIYADGEDGMLPLGELADERLSHTPQASRGAVVPFDPTRDRWEDVERRARRAYLEAILAACAGDRPRAIERSGLGRSTFFKWMSELGLAERGQD